MKYTSGALVASKFNNEVQPTKNGKFSLRCRIETGTNEAYRAAQTLGIQLTDEERDKHVKFQTLFIFSQNKESLEHIRLGLLDGDKGGKRSVLVRGNFSEFTSTYVDEETGEMQTSQCLSIYENKLQGYNRALKQWVPSVTAFLG